MSKKKIILPDNYDPYDKELKKLFHEKADKLNIIGQPRGFPQLLCGAMKGGKPCKCVAGRGTNHTGYGRCRMHGGASTGPKTPEGKAVVSQNGRQHGFYSTVLTPYDYEIFKQLAGDVSLKFEINLWKAKIVRYLQGTADKWKRAYEERQVLGDIVAEEYADTQTRRVFTTYNGANNSTRSLSYHMGTIEDKALLKALEVLGRLIEVQTKLSNCDDETAENIIEQVNKELQAASYGQVHISLTAE